jgi:hypothetical protein
MSDTSAAPPRRGFPLWAKIVLGVVGLFACTVLLVRVGMAALDDAADTGAAPMAAASRSEASSSTPAAAGPALTPSAEESEQEREVASPPSPSPSSACRQPPAELVATLAEGLAMAGNGWQRDGAVVTSAVRAGWTKA